MMNGVFLFLILFSVICGVATGRVEALSAASFDGAKSAIELIIAIVGVMCLWCGLMRIVEQSGLAKKIARGIRPITNFLFPDSKNNPKAMEYISMNITANLIGVTNGATPLGLKAMEELSKQNKNKGVASNAMSTLVILNTASIQIIPSTLIAMRMAYGSGNPFEIMVPMWCASFAAAVTAIGVAKALERVM